MPDEKRIRSLEAKVKQGEREVNRLNKELDKLVNLALSGTLSRDTIKNKETELIQAQSQAKEELDEARAELRAMPDIDQVRREAENIRRELVEHFGNPERLAKMSFDDKKRLLFWLFDGKDRDGKPYGIYVRRHGHGRSATLKVDYFFYGRIVGLRTLKGADINYQGWDEDEAEAINEYKTNNTAGMRRDDLLDGVTPDRRSCQIRSNQ